MITLFHKKTSTFYWQGITSDGTNKSGEMNALTLKKAQNQLIRHQIRILSIKKKKQSFTLINQTFYLNMKIIFFNQLATLLRAGIPLLSALDIACHQEKNHPLIQLHDGLRNEILAGNGLACGLEKYSQYFDSMTCHLIRAGEKTGTLEFLLTRIAEHLQKMSELRRKMTRACFYPAITLIFSSLITVIMLSVITPRFATLFRDMQAPLPKFTQYVLYLGDVVHNFFLPCTSVVFFIIFLVFHFRHTPRIQHAFDWLALHTPILNRIIKKIILARFARTLATLLSAGLPMIEALNMTAPTTRNSYSKQLIDSIQREVSLGQQLHDAMKNKPFFPSVMQQMIQAGEESGTLTQMLEKTAEFHEADIDHSAALMSQLLEPLIMVILGVLIGTLVIAMYLPIFKLGNAI